MIVSVTHAEIQAGAPYQDADALRQAFYCPVALALRRSTGLQWSVCSRCADVPQTRCKAGHLYRDLPAAVGAWIKMWAMGEEMLPISFEIDYVRGVRNALTPWYHYVHDDDETPEERARALEW